MPHHDWSITLFVYPSRLSDMASWRSHLHCSHWCDGLAIVWLDYGALQPPTSSFFSVLSAQWMYGEVYGNSWTFTFCLVSDTHTHNLIFLSSSLPLYCLLFMILSFVFVDCDLIISACVLGYNTHSQMTNYLAIYWRMVYHLYCWHCSIARIRCWCAASISMPKSQPANVSYFPSTIFACSSKKSARKSRNAWWTHSKRATTAYSCWTNRPWMVRRLWRVRRKRSSSQPCWIANPKMASRTNR